jgi:serine/threonine protein kinase
MLSGLTPFAIGGNSKIYSASLDGRPVAVKVSTHPVTREELDVLRKLQRSPHYNVVTTLDILENKKPPWVVMEKMENDLANVIMFNAKHGTALDFDRIRDIMYQLLSGITHLHHHRIMHRDIKPDNILLRNNRVAIADFGLAVRPRRGKPMSTNVVTMTYRAPELWLGDEGYSYGVDIWPVGVILYQLMWLRMPWLKFSDPYEALLAIFATLGPPERLAGWSEMFPGVSIPQQAVTRPLVPDHAPWTTHTFIRSLLEYDKGARIMAETAVEHAFFCEVDDDGDI